MKAAAALALIATACGGGGKASTPAAPVSPVPLRAATAGDAVLARLPAGADVLIELDMARLRGNEAVGGLVTDALASGEGVPQLPFVGAIEPQVLATADAIVMASYDVGTAQATTLTLVVGPDGVDGPSTDAAVRLADDTELLILRARSMPVRATGAVLRVTARLDFDARVALASQLDVSEAPAALSMWGDVADDLAVVALIDAPDAGGGAVGDEVGKGMVTALEAWRDDIAARAEVAALGLRQSVEEIRVAPRGEGVKVVALIGPRRLGRAVRRVRAFLQSEKR